MIHTAFRYFSIAISMLIIIMDFAHSLPLRSHVAFEYIGVQLIHSAVVFLHSLFWVGR